MRGINHYVGGLSDTLVCEDVSYRNERDTYDLFSHSHYSLRGLVVSGCTVPVPDSDAVCQDALDGSSVERLHDGCRRVHFSKTPKEAGALLGFLGEGCGVDGPVQIISVHPQ